MSFILFKSISHLLTAVAKK